MTARITNKKHLGVIYIFSAALSSLFTVSQKTPEAKQTRIINLPDASITKMNPSSYGKYSNHNGK
ncbi:hypothetical protein ACIRRB_005084 [Escherichia coli]|nr:hypothetical protein [Escherichia coli]EEZ0547030.1 hypothetical protein [Escherichia coli]EFB3227212.1 hypothetical protein [Escherichia coli]EFB9532383.1 hypothetical protein [Escherichia coli]EFB9568088.1 hypothetical protein [Escherichia coli]